MSPFEDTIIDHLNIGVSDAERSKAFYEAALAPLGLKLLHSIPPEQAEEGGEQQKTRGTMHGFGRQYKPLFWIVGNAKVGESDAFRIHRADAQSGRCVPRGGAHSGRHR